MLILNRSRYPDDDIARLVRFGLQSTPTNRLGVLVRNLDRGPARGVARNHLPPRCPFSFADGVRHYISLDIGPSSAFPATNLMRTVLRRRRVKISKNMLIDEHGQPRSGRDAQEYLKGQMHGNERLHAVDLRRSEAILAEYGDIPYGGRSSPLLEYVDWQEAVVAFAAHEGRHIQQFIRRDEERKAGKARTPSSESDAERHASVILQRFRRERDDVLREEVYLSARRSDGRQRDPIYGIAQLIRRAKQVRGGEA